MTNKYSFIYAMPFIFIQPLVGANNQPLAEEFPVNPERQQETTIISYDFNTGRGAFEREPTFSLVRSIVDFIDNPDRMVESTFRLIAERTTFSDGAIISYDTSNGSLVLPNEVKTELNNLLNQVVNCVRNSPKEVTYTVAGAGIGGGVGYGVTSPENCRVGLIVGGVAGAGIGFSIAKLSD